MATPLLPNGVRRFFRLSLRRRDLIHEAMDEELRFHLQERVEQLMAGGLTEAEAHAEATRRFGRPLSEVSAQLHFSAERRERSLAMRERIDELLADCRYVVRGLRREPLFAVFVVAVFGLGIGANAAMYGVVDRLLLRGPEHLEAPSRLLRLFVSGRTAAGEERTSSDFGYVAYAALRRDTKSFAEVAGYSLTTAVLGQGVVARRLPVGYATASLFPLLGVHPELGHFFTEAEDATAGAERVAVISYEMWRRDFGGDPAVLGRTMLVDDASYRIVGVAPAGFTGPELGRVDAWMPMSGYSVHVTPNWTESWSAQWLKIVARERPGTRVELASSQASIAYRNAYTGSNPRFASRRIVAAPLRFDAPGHESTQASVARWLAGVALIVLLIACSNVVNMLLARAMRRRGEVGVRVALGASRVRLIQLFVVEGMLLALLGGIAGVVVAYFAGQLVRTQLLPGIAWPDSPVSGRMLLFSAAVTMAVGVVVSLVPALRATRPDVMAVLKVRRGGSGQHSRLRNSLTIVQTSLSVALLIGAGLFVASLSRVRAVDLGIEPERVLTLPVNWPDLSRFPAGAPRSEEVWRRTALLSRVAESLRQFPGVTSASTAIGLPFGSAFMVDLRIAGRDSLTIANGLLPGISAVGPDYFATVGTSIVSGRAFNMSDRAGSEPVAIVSALMARTFWPGRVPLGECLYVGGDSVPCARIVGVAEDTHRQEVREVVGMHYYIPVGQESGFGGATLLVRSDADPLRLTAAVQRALFASDPTIGYSEAQSLQQAIDPQLRQWRLGATVFTLLGVLALLVAAVGLYSLVAYLVADRHHEFGVRLALGATSTEVLWLVLRSSLGLVMIGALTGGTIAIAAGRLLEPLLFETSARDPLVYLTVVALMVSVAGLAALIPGRHAAMIRPIEALKSE